jgi:Co/Zn/Cd efflux system component
VTGRAPAEATPVETLAPRGAFRRIVLLVAGLNLGYFGIELIVAFAIGSVSLLADGIDFLEDASINLLIAVALGWSAAWRARTGRALAGLLLVPALSAVWMAWSKLADPVPPGAFALSLTGLGALAVNLACALLLARHRHHAGSLSRAAWLSARNDVLANIAIVAAGALTAWTLSMWPDLVVGLGIAAMNADAAREVWQAAGREHLAAEA